MSAFRGSRILGGVVLAASTLTASRAAAVVTLTPTSGSIYPTQSTAVTATVFAGRTGISAGVHTLSVTGLPAGVATIPSVVTYTGSALFVQTTAVVNFQIAAGGQAVAGTYTVNVIDATYGSATYTLTILEPQLAIFLKLPSFTLAGSPVTESVGFRPDPGFGFNAKAGVPVVFAVDAGGAPANVTAGGLKTLLPPFDVQLLFTFRRTGPVTGGVYVVPVTATWTGTQGSILTASANVTMTVPDVAVTVGPPPGASVCNGGLTVPSASVTFTPLGGYQGVPTVATVSVPGGMTITPPTLPLLPPPHTAVFQLLGSGAPVGGQVFTAHVFDASAGVDRPFTVPFQVINNDIVPSVAPSVLALQAGGPSQPFSVTATPPPPSCGTPPFVTVSLIGLPAGFVVPAPVTLQPTVYATLPMAVSAGAGVAPGTYPATVRFAPGIGATKDVPVSITVSAAPPQPDFVLTAVPSSLTLTPGSSGKVTFTVTPQGGFTAQVTLNVPSNPNIQAVPSTYTFPAAGGSVDVTFTAAPNATAATVPVTVSAAGGGGIVVSHTVSVTVVVQPPTADFNLRVLPSAPAVPAGRSVPLSFFLDAVGTFAGTATVTAASLPPGATLTPPSFVLSPGVSKDASVSVPRATPPGTYTLVFRADEVPSPTPRRPLLISKTVSVPLAVQPAVGGFTVTVSPTTVLVSPEQAVAVRYTLQNLGDTALTITGDSFVLRDRTGAVLSSVEEPLALTLPPRGALTVSNTILVTGDQFARAGSPPIVLADRVFRAAPDATGYVDTAGAAVTVTAANSLIATASATRISIVYPPTGTLVGRGDTLRAQGLLIGSGTGNLLVGWFFDGILVETATVPLQNGTPTSVTNAISLPTLVSGNHEIALSVLAPNTLSSPAVQIYVEEGQRTLRLVSPTAGAVLSPAFGAPTFSWIPAPGIARYGVGLRRREPGAQWRWTFTTDTRWSPPASLWNSLAEGDYEWGVRGFTNTSRAFLDAQSGGASAPPTSEGSPDMAEGWTVTSAQGRFSIGGSETSLQNLEGHATLGDGSVRFTWKEIPGALYIHTLYEQGPGGLQRVRTEVVNKPGLLIPTAAFPRGGPFVWRVSAVDKEGRPLGAMAAAPVPVSGGAR